jgi:hypothetical protein
MNLISSLTNQQSPIYVNSTPKNGLFKDFLLPKMNHSTFYLPYGK